MSDSFNTIDLQIKEKKAKEKRPKADKVSEILVNLTLDSSVELYLDQLGEPHISFPQKPIVGFPIKSATFKRWLAGQYWEGFNKGFSGDTFQTVTSTLEGKCFHENQTAELYNRIARVDGVIHYDLGDDIRVVKIDKDGWEITTSCPVKFRRFKHQTAQIEPSQGGKLTDVLRFLNLKSETDKLLMLTYLAAACIPDIKRAMLIATGDQGSAKSTGLRIARTLIDPSQIELLDPINDLKELALAANHHYCLYLDNLSYLRDDISDALSRLATGTGSTKRKLFSDEEDIVFKQLCAVGLSGITLVATKPDLLDRSLILTYNFIPPEERLGEEELWRDFNSIKPLIFGGLLDILSNVLKIAPSLKFEGRPRMADYARYATAAAIALGFTQEDFLLAYDKNVSRQNKTALEASVTANTIIQFMEEQEFWEGYSSELYARLRTIVDETKQQVGGDDGFPRAANALWKRILKVRPNLASIGIYANRDENSTGSLITLTKKSVQESENTATNATTATMGTKPSGDYESAATTTATHANAAAIKSTHEMATMAVMATNEPTLDKNGTEEIFDEQYTGTEPPF